MALQNRIILDNGIDMTSAYIKVSEVTMKEIASDTTTAVVQVLVYYNEDYRNQFKPEVVQFNHAVTGPTFVTYFSDATLKEAGKSPMSQSYLYLKTLPLYEDSVDV